MSIWRALISSVAPSAEKLEEIFLMDIYINLYRINFLPSSSMLEKEVMIRLGTRQEIYLIKLHLGKILLKIDANRLFINLSWFRFMKYAWSYRLSYGLCANFIIFCKHQVRVVLWRQKPVVRKELCRLQGPVLLQDREGGTVGFMELMEWLHQIMWWRLSQTGSGLTFINHLWWHLVLKTNRFNEKLYLIKMNSKARGLWNLFLARKFQ